MKLIINQPYINNDKLISLIEYEDKKYEMFFQVEDSYKKYLCDDNANAFLIALIPFIVKHNYDVIIKSNISSKLYYQITTYLMPMLCNAFGKKNINIKCDLMEKTYNSKGVGASISCGVDSFYTLFKHQDLKNKKKNITHLCFFNAGSNGNYGGDEARRLYKERVGHIRDFCINNNYELVVVDSNMNELIMMDHEKRHTFTTLSCVYALEKLFSTYYFASGLGFDGSHIEESDTAYYDILNVKCLSNENITFYCSGIEATRMEKTEFISKYEETYDWLNVCVGKAWKNCGKCTKCIRTMTSLEAIGKLEKYKNVFDLEEYYKNRNVILSRIIIGTRNKIQKGFNKEILQTYKKNNINIPLISYIISVKPTKDLIKNFLKTILPQKIIDSIKKRKNKNKINDGWTD